MYNRTINNLIRFSYATKESTTKVKALNSQPFYYYSFLNFLMRFKSTRKHDIICALKVITHKIKLTCIYNNYLYNRILSQILKIGIYYSNNVDLKTIKLKKPYSNYFNIFIKNILWAASNKMKTFEILHELNINTKK